MWLYKARQRPHLLHDRIACHRQRPPLLLWEGSLHGAEDVCQLLHLCLASWQAGARRGAAVEGQRRVQAHLVQQTPTDAFCVLLEVTRQLWHAAGCRLLPRRCIGERVLNAFLSGSQPGTQRGHFAAVSPLLAMIIDRRDGLHERGASRSEPAPPATTSRPPPWAYQLTT